MLLKIKKSMTEKRETSNSPHFGSLAVARQIKGDSLMCTESPSTATSFRLRPAASESEREPIHVDRIDSRKKYIFRVFSRELNSKIVLASFVSVAELRKMLKKETEKNTFLRAKFMGFYSVIIVRPSSEIRKLCMHVIMTLSLLFSQFLAFFSPFLAKPRVVFGSRMKQKDQIII
jgi:hypothetical protein